MFKVTEQEIQEAKSMGFYQLKDNTTYRMIINGVEEKEDAIIIKCLILSDEGNGQSYNLFFHNNKYAKSELVKLMLLFFTQEELVNGISFGDMISRIFEADARSSKDGKFVNLKNYRLFDDTPSVPDTTEVKTTAPDATKTNQGLF